ncbi:DUF5680 domain-containing protein [Candidatus Gracilibacteria bacterium]|nr:DUF5680 domain-containing protein [Candidatus Gracilibacteria bacterium]
MLDKDRLCEFLVEAKKSTYAAGDSRSEKIEKDFSKTLIFRDGNRKYHDNYFGGEPYGGREVVFFKGQPVYIMTYYGAVNEDISDLKMIYTFLQESLKLIPLDKPFRGPREYKKDSLAYINDFVGEINNFSGEEKILENGKEIYRAKYMGGLVDQRK